MDIRFFYARQRAYSIRDWRGGDEAVPKEWSRMAEPRKARPGGGTK